jgi:hypothetical protein
LGAGLDGPRGGEDGEDGEDGEQGNIGGFVRLHTRESGFFYTVSNCLNRMVYEGIQ